MAGATTAGSNMSRHRRWGDTLARCARTRCSRTVRPWKSSGCWNVRASPLLARARGDAWVTSSPWSHTAPALGRCKPDRTPRSVDFPAPFGPTSPAMPPGCTSMETSDSARSPPKRTVMPLATSAAVVVGRSGRGRSLGGRHETRSVIRGAPSTAPTPDRRAQVAGRLIARTRRLEPQQQGLEPPALLGQCAVGVLGCGDRAEAEADLKRVGEPRRRGPVEGEDRVREHQHQTGDQRSGGRAHADGHQDGQPDHAGKGGELARLERRLGHGVERAADPGDQRGE